jgi:drug/metabolite transporter (DMT)-like permease
VTHPASEVATEVVAVRMAPSSPPGTGRASIVLVLVTLFWGLSFPLMKDWQAAATVCPGGALVSGVTLIALRMALGLLLLGLLQPGLLRNARPGEHAIGVLIGATFLVGFTLQVVGLAWTTPARSAFITSLGSAWVPLVAWVCFRQSVPWSSLLGLTLGIIGAAVLSLGSDALRLLKGEGSAAAWTLSRGDGLTLLSSMIFAVQILLLDRLGRRARSSYLSIGFFTVSAVSAAVIAVFGSAAGPGIDAWLRWTGSMLGNQRVLIELGILTVFPTVLAFHLMNVYQPRVSASRAALIYLLEPVFGAAFSVAWGLDKVGWGLLIGGAFILGGNVLVELPIWRPHGVSDSA